MVPRLSVAFSRVALFKVHGNRLEGEHQAGFDPKTDINKVAIPVGMDSLLSRAASSGRTERLSGPELAESGLVPFKGTPTFALAVPVALHGETLAILYADDSGHAAADSATYEMRTRFADALVQHGTSVLMRLTAELKALAELRDYAKSLLTEIEEMFLADAGADKPEDELHNRLKGHLEYARSIFATRVAMEGPGAATLLEDELSTIVETKGSSPFGRALSVVSGIAAPGARAAEAS
jgi:hypothetical protein